MALTNDDLLAMKEELSVVKKDLSVVKQFVYQTPRQRDKKVKSIVAHAKECIPFEF